MKQKPLFYGLALVLLAMVLFAYANHFHNPFHFDDEHTIVTNAYIRDIHNWPLFFKDGKTFSSLPANQAYRPGVTLLDAIDCWFGHTGVPVSFPYHVHIFISYLLLGFFLYLFVIKLFDTAFKDPLNPYIALLTTGVFMLHTSNAETINYIISRSDAGSTLMILISLCVYAYYPHLRKFGIYIFIMMAGFFVKENAAIIAPLVFLYLYLIEEEKGFDTIYKSGWSTLWNTLPAFVGAVVVFAFAQHMTPEGRTLGGGKVNEYLMTESFVMIHYVNNFFLPFNLTADTDWNLITNFFDDRVLIGLAFILFTLYLAYRASLQQKWRPVTFGILWFYLALAPTSSFFPFAEVLNDHRVFFPYIGLAIATVWALFMVYKKYEVKIAEVSFAKPLIYFFIGAFLVAHMFGVRQRTKVWSTEQSLWYDVTIKSPKNGRGLMNYGNVLMGKGDYVGALDYFTRAKKEWPGYSYIYVNLGVLDNAMGKYADAEQNFKYAMQLNPENPNCYYYYANMLKGQGRMAEAKQLVERGLAISHEHVDLKRLYAEITNNPAYAGQIKGRVEALEELAKTQPTKENYINLSLQYYYAGRYQDCANAAEQAAKIDPNYDLAYNNICSAYNMLHEWDKAIAAGQKAVQLNPNSQLAKNNLNVALQGKQKGN